ncbi:uncharacterized protein LOC129587182 [Paramacrobiotus metropolitanus]|uniref:uncharacterized protein LOC129587182 n=1 Tax=Paramacrobiotus metropolitanus TaxID=2943436 RepID=UPI002445B22D|nr:uncharacterized protein LOC129587182 [Paramacrobiotus metropolitanus]
MSDAVGLLSVDFLPVITGFESISSLPEYESFPVLVERANYYLRNNPLVTVNTCESVEFRVTNRGCDIQTRNSVYIAPVESSTRYARGLRLWIQRKVCHSTSYDQIGYDNFLPDIYGQKISEGLESVMAKINHRYRHTPLKGRIITVETQPVKWGSRGLDPDRTIWKEHAFASTLYVNVIRIFYIIGTVKPCQVGVHDIVPAVLESGGLFSRPKMESFQPVIQRASQWLMSLPPNCRPVNVQTVMFRWSNNQGINTNNLVYQENNTRQNCLRYLRVGFVMENPTDGPPARSLIQLHCKLIVPRMTFAFGCRSTGEFETQESTRNRVNAWVRATGARVVCVESLFMRTYSDGTPEYGFDDMRPYDAVTSGPKSSTRAEERFVHLYRIYTDGHYPDPPSAPTWQTLML